MNYDFPKLIQLDEFTHNSEPTIQIIRPRDFTVPHVKLADEALDYIKHVRPMPGKTIILVLAMTAGEYYGPNKNGDAWPEHPLMVGGTKITEDEVLPKHYKSFETSAKVYRHHINKDPAGSIGDIQRAFYNWLMHRVELLLALDNNKAEEVVQEIESGKFPAVSMGCKIRADICSICGNQAPNRAAYCDHAKWQLSQFMPNGKQVFVWNPAPKFFDLSIVRRPADRIGFMMKKVAEVAEVQSSAELGERVARLSKKLADANKLSIISKIINGDVAAAKEDDGELNVVRQFAENVAKPVADATPPLDDSILQELIRHRPAEVLSTLASMGIYLTTPEFIKFFIWKLAPGTPVPEQYLRRAVETQRAVFDILAHNPELAEEIEQTDFLDIAQGNINADLQKRLAPLLEKRSYLRPYVERRLVDLVFKKTAASEWGALEIVDPATGICSKTAHAVEKTQRWNARFRGLLGSAALLAGAYKLAELTDTGMNTKTATLRMLQEHSLTTGAQYEIPRVTLHKLSSASFEKVALWLGEGICL